MTGAGKEHLPLVLVHGYLGGAAQWAGLTDEIVHSDGVISINLPGFSNGSDEIAPETIEGFAQHVIAELDHCGVDRFMLLGHSMGGMIVQEVARLVPDRVERLVLYGTGPLGAMPDRFEPIETSVARLHRDGVAATAHRIAATWFVDGAAHPGFDELARIGADASAEAAHSALLAMAAWDGRAALGALGMPSLIIWGDCDRSYRWPQVERLWQGLPSVSLAVVPGASHVAHVEKPAIFVSILQDFLNRRF